MKMKYVSFFAILIFLITLFIYIFKIGGESYILITDILAVLFGGVAVICGYMAFRCYGIKSLHGKSIFLITMGAFLWFMANFVYLLFYTKAYAISETFGLMAYAPFIAGFFFILKLSDPKFRKDKKYIILFLIVLFIFAIGYIFILPFIIGTSLLYSITTYGYIATDLILLFGIILLLRVSHSYKGGMMGKVWVIFAAAFLSVFLFDLYFALLPGKYYQGSILEVLILVNYILMAVGFYYNLHIMANIKQLISKK